MLTRAATYGVLFGVGYGLPLGPTYGIVAGAGLGLALSRFDDAAARYRASQTVRSRSIPSGTCTNPRRRVETSLYSLGKYSHT